MPISGVVINTVPAEVAAVARQLAALAEVEVHGHDAGGHVVAVLETESSAAMETLVTSINALPAVLGVGLTYLNTEDEAGRQEQGERLPLPAGFRGREKA